MNDACHYITQAVSGGYIEAGFGTGDSIPFAMTVTVVEPMRQGDILFHENLPTTWDRPMALHGEVEFRTDSNAGLMTYVRRIENARARSRPV